MGGVIVTFTSWRVIFWLQLGMSGLGLLLSLLFFPKIEGTSEKVSTAFKPTTLVTIISKFSPTDVLKQWVYPNVFLAVSVWDIYPLHLLESDMLMPQIKGLMLWTPGNYAIFDPDFRSCHIQLTVSFNDCPGIGSLLPRSRCRVPDRQSRRR